MMRSIADTSCFPQLPVLLFNSGLIVSIPMDGGKLPLKNNSPCDVIQLTMQHDYRKF